MTFVWHIPCCCELDQRLYCEGPAVADDLERLLVALRPKPSLLKKKLQKKKPQHATIPVEELARQLLSPCQRRMLHDAVALAVSFAWRLALDQQVYRPFDDCRARARQDLLAAGGRSSAASASAKDVSSGRQRTDSVRV